MSKLSRCLFPVVLMSVFSMFGCSGVSTGAPASPTASVYQIVTVSDLHFNPFYDPTLFPALAAADASQWAGIFHGSKVTAPTGGGTDTNYPLLVLTLASMKQNMGASPVVLFTGDLLGHNIPKNFCAAYYSPKLPPSNCATSPDQTVGPLMQQFIDKTFAFVAGSIRVAVGKAPVIYVPGNIDTYGVGLGPNSAFLTSNAATVYSQFLTGSFDQRTFLNTFEAGGYYAVQPLGSGLLVIGLNTNSFVAGSPSYGDANAELSWLNSQLSSAQAAGQKVWILMHVPPGANSQGIAQVAATPSDVDEKTTSMMWEPGLQSTFIQTLANYPGLVTLMLAGHTHMDEFRMLPTGDVLEQLPGISPCFGNNPAYKVLTITQDTFTPTDYQSFDYNLAAMSTQFVSLYQFSTTFGAQRTLGYSLQRLYPQLGGNQSKRDMYTLLYGSGSTTVNPVTFTPWNPINNVNWPIFACTISEMDEPDYLRCVSTY